MSKYDNVVRTPMFFGETDAPLFGWYHAPKAQQHATVMVVCPPIGYEYVHAYRSLRHLADHFAQSGIACLRFDYHGIGNSSGVDEDPDRIQHWLSSIRQAIRTAKQLSQCAHIGLIGFRMGATLASMIAEDVELACLILWAPCVRGRNYCREMKALRMTGAHKTDQNHPDQELIEGGGFVLTPQTIAALGTIDLHVLRPKPTRILVVMRDDLAEVSQKLDQWHEAELSLEYIKFSGYADMVAEPHYTKVPYSTLEHLSEWVTQVTARLQTLSSAVTTANTVSTVPSSMPVHVTIPVSQFETQQIKPPLVTIREYVKTFGSGNEFFSIVSEPVTGQWKTRPTIILPNAGAVHHVGPNRLYILLARNLARAGFRCVRMDLSGLGDSVIDDIENENDSYVNSATLNIASAMRALRNSDETFIVMGLCSGAHAAFHAGLDIKDYPLEECVLINPLTFYWKQGMSLSAPPSVDNRWHYYKNTMRQKERWIKLLRGKVNFVSIAKTILEKIQKTIKHKAHRVLTTLNIVPHTEDDLNHDIKVICNAGRRLGFFFSTTDPGYDILMSNGKNSVNRFNNKKMLTVSFIKDADHTFTTRAHRVEVVNKILGHLVKIYGE